MNMIFCIELDQGVKTQHDPAALEITRVGSSIQFTVIDGTRRIMLKGQCEPDELKKLADMLGD